MNLLSSGMAFAKLYALTSDEEKLLFESDQLYFPLLLLRQMACWVSADSSYFRPQRVLFGGRFKQSMSGRALPPA